MMITSNLTSSVSKISFTTTYYEYILNGKRDMLQLKRGAEASQLKRHLLFATEIS